MQIIQANLVDRIMFLIKDDALTNMVCKDGTYEPHVTSIISSLIKPGDNVFDLGANCGFHTITMSKLVGSSGKVISFEPQRFIFQQLNGNVFINGLQNVYAFNAAVGDEDKLISINTPDYNKIGNIGDTHIENNSNGNEKMNMVALDSLNISNVKFIKLDIQGCELHALRGCKNTILKSRPIMIIELEDFQLIRFGTTIDMIITYLKDTLQYKLLQIIKDNMVVTADYLCIPSEVNIKSLNIPGY